MTIDTDKERTLSNKRAGARIVRKAIQAEIKRIRLNYGDAFVQQALNDVTEFIDGMIARDKKRKGGLWN